MSTALKRDLRRLVREPLKSKVRLAWQNQDGHPCYAQCHGVDISEHGMRLEGKQPVPLRVPVQVQIDTPAFKASATVSWCRRARLNYHIGLQFVGKTWKGAITQN